MKKPLSLLLALSLVLALTACGSKNDGANTDGDAQNGENTESVDLVVFAAASMTETLTQIDGQDNPITITCTNKFYEVQKFYTLTEHMFCGNCVVVNAAWFHSLPEDYQTALREAVKDMIAEQRRLVDESESADIQEMTDNGCTVTTLTDEQKQAFVDATQSVRDDFVKEFGEAGQTMLDLAAKYE